MDEDEALDLARHLGASFYHVKRSANKVADELAKEGGSQQSLI